MEEWTAGYAFSLGLEAEETYTVAQIREAYRKYAHDDDWGVPTFYESGLIASLRGEYDNDSRNLRSDYRG